MWEMNAFAGMLFAVVRPAMSMAGNEHERIAVAQPDAPDLELVADLYDAVGEPDRLREVMERVAGVIGCDAAYFKMIDRAAGRVMIGTGGGMPEGSDRDYLEHYLHTDVRVPRVDRAPPRQILDDRQVILPAEQRRSAFHNEFLPKYDLGYLLHVNLSRSPALTSIVTCAQSAGRGEFAARQSRTLEAYVPHFERAGGLYLRLLRLGGQAVLMSAAFDGLPIPGMILKGDGELIFANVLATERLAAGDGVMVRQGKLAALDPQADVVLSQAIRAAALADGGNGAADDNGVLLIRRTSGRPSYRLEVRPLPARSGFRREATAAAVLVFLYDPEARANCQERMLRKLYRLTPAEAALALAVGAGASLREYALQRGVTFGTVRYQIKQVLAKTDCRRQADLIRLLR